MKYQNDNPLSSLKNNSSIQNPQFDISHFPTTNVLDKKLSEMLPEESKESKTIQDAKEILGSTYTTEEIKELIASFEYLTTNWLEEYEQKIFEGKTLKEILLSV